MQSREFGVGHPAIPSRAFTARHPAIQSTTLAQVAVYGVGYSEYGKCKR